MYTRNIRIFESRDQTRNLCNLRAGYFAHTACSEMDSALFSDIEAQKNICGINISYGSEISAYLNSSYCSSNKEVNIQLAAETPEPASINIF